MLYSMTGFGRTECTIDDYNCVIEIRSLNGKQFEVNTKISSLLKLYEIELRNKVQQLLSRGSIEVSIFLKQYGNSKPISVNVDLAKFYHNAITEIATTLNLPQNDILPTLMRMPDIVSNASETLNEKSWTIILQKVEEVCAILTAHRKQEGVMLAQHIETNITTIKNLCNAVDPFEKNRTERLREKLTQALHEFLKTNNADKNRFEQELIYYIEKYDITEEKNRLKHHCDYFIELLKEDNNNKGKKLGFLIQEIGREINTMGSKANDVDIQKIVVDMKDELEQAKEQLLNAL